MHNREFMCVNCMQPSSSLYQIYSEGVIRLSDCRSCGAVVDKYVEYDTMLVIIDLIIHNISAYRHLIYNMKIQYDLIKTNYIWNEDKYRYVTNRKVLMKIADLKAVTAFKNENQLRVAVIFLFCDAYDKWISGRAGVYNIYDLEWIFYKSLLQSTLEMCTYVAVIIFCEILVHSFCLDRIELISRGTIIGYYGNVAVVLSIIFRLSKEFSYRSVTQLFIFVSHIQVQRTLFPDLSLVTNCVFVAMGVALSMLSGLLCRSFLEY